MTVSGSRRRPLVLRLSLTAAIAATVAGSSVAFASPAVSAPMPVRTAAAPAFTAGLCEGTEYTPSEQMLEISGIRLDHYNDGNIVPMYGTTDRGTSAAVDAPVCGVRDVDGIAKSEWMYCTDFDLDPCAGVDENGLPVDKHNDEMGATVPSSGNPDLSADDLAVISWLLQNPAKLDGCRFGKWQRGCTFGAADACVVCLGLRQSADGRFQKPVRQEHRRRRASSHRRDHERHADARPRSQDTRDGDSEGRRDCRFHPEYEYVPEADHCSVLGGHRTDRLW